MINTSRWETERITPGLGQEWWFPAQTSYKPYPHCRILHAPLEALTEVLETHHIRVDEIEEIKAWVEGFVMQPLWLNREITHVTQGQFSIAHGLSVGAHRVPPGKKWQSPEVVFNPSVIALMDKVKFEVHPDYEKLLTGNAASRPTRIEVRARGQTFVGERQFPKGSPSPDPSTRMSNDELVAKFERNAEGVLDAVTTAAVVDQIWNLDRAVDVRNLMSALACGRKG
jgi:2-methylcitrate dehydratase PrpD